MGEGKNEVQQWMVRQSTGQHVQQALQPGNNWKSGGGGVSRCKKVGLPMRT